MDNRSRDAGASPEVRCDRCKAVLAVRQADGLLVRRGRLQTCTTGSYAMTIVCYRCNALNVVTSGKK